LPGLEPSNDVLQGLVARDEFAGFVGAVAAILLGFSFELWIAQRGGAGLAMVGYGMFLTVCSVVRRRLLVHWKAGLIEFNVSHRTSRA
jgi:hypothetical protein